VFTIGIHLFGILLSCVKRPSLLSAAKVDVAEARQLLGDSLITLQVVGERSLMSQKVVTCMLRFLEIFDSLGELFLPGHSAAEVMA
jgi:hypothetical protein